MKNVFCYLCVFLLSVYTASGSARGTTTEPREILIVSSYSPVRENSNHIISALSEQVSGLPGIDLRVEYMDCESSPAYAAWQQWMKHLFAAFSRRPELVVLIGQEAWSAYRTTCCDLWKSVPVVLGGVKKGLFYFEKNEQSEIRELQDIRPTSESFGDFRVTGYYTEDYIRENLAYIRRLQPEIRHILYFYDDPHRLPFLENYLGSLMDPSDSVRLRYLPGSRYPTARLLDTIRQAGPSSAVLAAGWYSDANQYPHAYSMLHNELERFSGQPVYQLYNQGFHADNYVGGYFVSGKDQGKDLGALIAHILEAGFDKAPSFRKTPSAPSYYFNYRSIDRLGIDPARLPPGTVYLNRPHTFIENHPETVFAFSIVLIFLVLAILLLLLYRRHTTLNYQKYYRQTQQLLASMPNMVTVFDADGTICDIVNPLDDVLIGIEARQLIGQNIDNIEKINPYFKNAARLFRLNLRKSTLHKKTVTFNYQVKTPSGTFHTHTRIVPFDDGKILAFSHDITSRVRAEQENVQLKVFLQSVIDHLPLPVFVKNASDDFRYLYYNDKCLNFYGGKIEDFMDKNDFEANDPNAATYREEDLQVLKSDKPLTFERILYDAQGQPYRWGMTTKTKLIHSDGTRYIIAVLTETTDSRKREIELHNIRNELSLALGAGSLSAWIYSVDTRQFTTLYGETVAGAGMAFDEAYRTAHPDDREKYATLMQVLASGREKKKREILRFLQDGEYHWFETHALALPSPRTGRIEHIVGTQKDITREVEAEEKNRADKFKTDLAIRSSGIMQWDYDLVKGTFVSPNPESFIFDQPVPADEYFSHIHPDDWPAFRESLDRLIRKERRTANLRLRQNRPGVGWRWVEIHCVAFGFDTEGNLTQITGLLRDITEMKKLTDELAAKEKAEALNRLKSAFLANMSHEIRTPLNAIVGFSGLIAQTDDPQEQQEYHRIIETNNELLLQLVDDILDLSKIEAGQLDFAFTDFDLVDVFSQLAAMYRYRVKNGVSLQCRLPDASCIVRSEKNRLTQVLSNFLSNATKFTSEGFIRMGYTHTDNGLRFYVTDTGKGIAAENLPHVFERFAKFDNFVQGTGLGLSICQTIIEHLQGEIGVESEPGRGSTFWFAVPCEIKKRDAVEKASLPAEPETPVREPAAGSVRTVLVAEDNDSNYLLIDKTLGKSYRLIRAVDGKEAVSLYDEHRPDIILMDIKMPVMDGITATRLIRSCNASVPIIALTAHAFEADKAEALQAGCTGFLTKPVDIRALKEMLGSV